MIRFLTLLPLFCILLSTVLLAREDHPAHSSQGIAFNEGPRQKSRFKDGMGKLEFDITPQNSETRRFFLQGVGQLHGFFSFEAERSFRTAAALDPSCAMCYWGMAMANTVNLAGSRSRAKEFIELAKTKSTNCTQREKDWINTLWTLYQNPLPITLNQREFYAKDLEKLTQRYPNELEAKAFLALTLWENFSFFGGKPQKETIDSLVTDIFLKNPAHPAHHYKIHNWDSLETGALALKSAAQCGPAAPRIAHMWHMPGHIYWRLKRFHDSAWQQEASARVDHADMAISGDLPYQIGNYYHNNSWLMSSLERTGDASKAIAVGKNLYEIPRHPTENPFHSYARDEMRILIYILDEYQMWEEALRLYDSPYLNTEDDKNLSLLKARLAVLSTFYLGKSSAEIQSHIQEVRRLLPNPIVVKLDQAVSAEMDIYESLVNTPNESILSQLKMLEPFTKQTASEWAMYSNPFPDFHLEDLYARQGAYTDALRYAHELVETKPGAVQPVAKEILAYRKNNQLDEARKVFVEKLLPISENIDLSTPLIKGVTSVAVELGFSEDWRVPRFLPTDLGERPALDTLGPLFWNRPKAPQGLHPDFDKYLKSQKPFLVVFFIGGCPACSEQLKTLTDGGWDKKFQSIGLDLIAIGSKKGGNHTTSFPLFSDESLKLFQSTGAYDEFENKPLHGIFLLDRNGNIAWKTVTADVFLEFGFLLKESERLLKLPG